MRILKIFSLILCCINITSCPRTNLFPGIPTDGIVASYLFNGNSNNSAGGNYHGQVTAGNITAVADRSRNQNSAYSFDGTAYIELIGSESLNFTDSNFTISLWVKFESDNNDTVIVGKHIPGYANSFFIGIGWGNNSKLNFFVNNDSRLETQDQYNDNKWHHVVGIYNKNLERQSLLIDNDINRYYTQQRVYNIPNTQKIYIGKGVKGSIDDIYIYNRVLTEDEIELLYNAW